MPIGEIVSQISPPMRILLAGAVVFLAVWFTLLRPKSPEAPVTATSTPAGNVNTGQPAQSGAGKIVEKAKQAATEAEGAAKAAAGESPSTDKTQAATGSKTTTAPDAKPADPVAAIAPEQLAKLPQGVASAIKDHKVLVLAVLSDKGKHWRPMADDDRYVRNTLKKVNRYDGEVVVKQVPLTKIDDYGLIVNDLKVNQTPSLVVVDTRLKANVIEGYVDTVSINQAIADARADSISPLITDSYLKSANKICANAEVSFDRWSNPTVSGREANLAAPRALLCRAALVPRGGRRPRRSQAVARHAQAVAEGGRARAAGARRPRRSPRPRSTTARRRRSWPGTDSSPSAAHIAASAQARRALQRRRPDGLRDQPQPLASRL